MPTRMHNFHAAIKEITGYQKKAVSRVRRHRVLHVPHGGELGNLPMSLATEGWKLGETRADCLLRRLNLDKSSLAGFHPDAMKLLAGFISWFKFKLPVHGKVKGEMTDDLQRAGRLQSGRNLETRSTDHSVSSVLRWTTVKRFHIYSCWKMWNIQSSDQLCVVSIDTGGSMPILLDGFSGKFAVGKQTCYWFLHILKVFEFR